MQDAIEPVGPQWMLKITPGRGTRYQQIVDYIEQAIGEGRLRPGDRVPPQRHLAKALGVDLTTVTRAYAEAKRRNLLDAKGALGTFIAAPRAQLAAVVDMSMNVPPPPGNLDFADLLRRGLSQVLLRSDPHLLMTYQLGGGSAADRAAGAQWLGPMMGAVGTSRLVVCPGAQAALAALILNLTNLGDSIAAESLSYPGLRSAAQQLDRKVMAIQSDDAGMLPDQLDAACAGGVRLIYLNPTMQNPTTRTMPISRREDLARVAAKYNARIVEDDPYWLLSTDAPSPIACVAPELTYYISTLSKTLSPGLRTAYVLLPDRTDHDDGFLAALRSFALMSMPIAVALSTQWILDGSAQQLLDGIRTEAMARREIANRWLSGIGQLPPTGIHVWHALPEHWSPEQLTKAALAEDLRVTPSDAFYNGPTPPNAIRISLGGARERAELSLALRKLAALLERKPTPRQIVV
ncbi:PLP-dependent aminotransferase family protein [Ralstonia soli]|uniref:PLP-dependent aminotransferase family protein n=1 Tax=Ralstonia soli TaxID=2953896 RepID=A0ABT1AL64_9RALS|nr:PLP-dependent aminotransferase family protein [Ralstonia soli]MCO5399128.1 PLP-dependent aminotransferase family protein [Ralstonia soli]